VTAQALEQAAGPDREPAAGGPLRQGLLRPLRKHMALPGPGYAASAGDALAVLALTYVPFVFHHFYLAISRVQNRVRRAGIFSILTGLAALVAAWYGGAHGTLTSLVWWLFAVMAVETAIIAPTVLRVALPTTWSRRGAPDSAIAGGS
jgi:hypothetical protein